MTFLVVVTPVFVQAIKKTELIPSKWLPTVSILVGAILGALATSLDGSGSLANDDLGRCISRSGRNWFI
ncbi:Phage holin [Listeria monocytogenes]|nr:Phage holin [Listeria monocytogenes]